MEDDKTYEKPLTSPYYRLYKEVCEIIETHAPRSVLEVGCGSGVLAEMLSAMGLSYTGFDFSSTAVEKAKSRGGDRIFFVGEAADPAAYERQYDAIVCCEVLEHIDEDLTAVGLWRQGAICVCSVPNFDGEHHVRFFKSESEVRSRYGGLLDIQLIARIPKSARANLSGAEYFRRLRWARAQPKRVLGMLGINAFSWYGGWFVFVGRRR
jgi:2-polyprenyl-3-methyl-5-hydroxy-6-metoxy-1,4-benzoquinol methylase